MFGCIPSTPAEVAHDDAHRPLTRLVGFLQGPPDRVDLLPHVRQILSQAKTSTCVAHAIPAACVISNTAKGHPIDDPSRRWAYDVSQWTLRPGKPLEDNGTSAYAMCNGLMVHGLVAERRFGWDAAKADSDDVAERLGWLLEPPPFDADVAGQDALALDYWRASSDPDELKLAMSRNEVPCIAIPVYENFVDWSTSDPYLAGAGDFLGNHMLAVVGYDGDVFTILNSWGAGWCRDGLIRMSADFIERHAFDRVVIRSAPAPR